MIVIYYLLRLTFPFPTPPSTPPLLNPWLQRKCEQYWREELHTPYYAGRNLSVITTKSYGIGTYSVSHLKLTSVSAAVLLCPELQ